MPEKVTVRTRVVIVLLAGLLLRLAMVVWMTPGRSVGPLDDDGDYFRYARVMIHHGYIAADDLAVDPQAPRAWRGPLFFTFQYVVFRLHGIDNFLAVRIYLAFLSLLVPLALFFFCARIWDGTTAFVALVWSTFHPAFIHYGAHVQSDSLTLVFSTWGIVLLIVQRNLREAALAGFIMGVATLGRSQFCLAVGVGFLWILANPNFAQRWRRAVLFFVMWMLPIFPWWVRNYRVFHHFVPFTTEGGFTLRIGLNDWTDGGGITRPNEAPKELSELEKDRWNYRVALTWAREHPRRTFELALSKLSRFWGLVPRVGGTATKLIAFLSYLPIFVLFLFGFWFWREKLWTLAPILAICIYYTALHSLFPAVMRYRLPVEPFMIALAAATLVGLWRQKSV